MKKRGFTLVELSIALVIVGLLIAGLLVGQSLVDSAKINAQIKQLQQYDIAAQQFKTKFKKLAGESNLTETMTYSGNCGSMVGMLTDTDCANNDAWLTESKIYWFDLVKLVNLDIGDCTVTLKNRTSTTTASAVEVRYSGNQCNTPQAAIKKNLAVLVWSYSFTDPSQGNYYYILNCDAMTTNYPFDCMAEITQSEALAYDKKVDDGVSDSGIVRAGSKATTITFFHRSHFLYSAYNPASSTKLVLMQALATNQQ